MVVCGRILVVSRCRLEGSRAGLGVGLCRAEECSQVSTGRVAGNALVWNRDAGSSLPYPSDLCLSLLVSRFVLFRNPNSIAESFPGQIGILSHDQLNLSGLAGLELALLRRRW
jgi:hypothetical protein